MAKEKDDFRWTEDPNPHHVRVREIIKTHPEVRQLIGKNPYSVFIIIALVAFQVFTAYLLRNQSWWLIVPVAYVVGAFPSHALWVMIHECGHYLVFKGKAGNLFAAIFANMPHMLPSAISFQYYHNKHHTHQSVHHFDGDMPDFWEAKLIKNNTFGKIIWMLLFPFFQVIHTLRLKDHKKPDFWLILNFVVQIAFNVAIWVFLGPKAFFYLFISFLFSVGLHPLGGRWIQEHYLVLDDKQETYSYYGPLNKVAFNVGYHNEHHDFPSIPWNKLPQVKKKVPEVYDQLLSHPSWTKLFLRFLFDPNLGLHSRVARKQKNKIEKPNVEVESSVEGYQPLTF